MSKLTWSAIGERFYESGVDRGVLYIDGQDGVAWTGLISVAEAPSGGDPRPYYIDGVKYLNLSSAEEFEATINAFSSPPEFAKCDGISSIQNGLFATQQPRHAFGMSYRTKIGNDTDGKDHGYKIHLVYNALAAPSDRENSTLEDSVNPSTFSWVITTLPPSLTGRKPTAHFVIDSRKTPKGLLKAIEDILYGTSELGSRLPLPQELIDMFSSEGPIVRTNYATNPAMRATSGEVVIAENALVTPSFEYGVGAWTPGPAFGPISVITNAVYIGMHGTNIAQCAATQAVSENQAIIYSDGISVSEGEVWSIGAGIVRTGAIAPATARLTMVFYDSGGSSITIQANQFVDVSTTAGYPATMNYGKVEGVVIPAGVAAIRVMWRATAAMAIGDTYRFDGQRSVRSATLPDDYFDGDTPADDTFTYHYTGSPGLSTSQKVGRPVAGWNPIGTVPVEYQRGLDVMESTGRILGNGFISASEGQYWAYRVKVRATGSGASLNLAGRAYSGGFGGYAGEVATQNVSLPSDGSWLDVEVPSSNPVATGGDNFRADLTPTLPAGVLLQVTDFMPVLVSGPGVEPGSYFDGSFPDDAGNFYSWEDTPDASVSYLNTWN